MSKKPSPIPKGVEVKGAYTKYIERRFLSSVDLIGQGVVRLTVTSVTLHETLKYDNGQLDSDVILIHFSEIHRPLKLNSTNMKAITNLVGSNKFEDWEGHKIPFAAIPGTYFGEKGYAVRVTEVAPVNNLKKNLDAALDAAAKTTKTKEEETK